jgi:hypothetical protein
MTDLLDSLKTALADRATGASHDIATPFRA